MLRRAGADLVGMSTALEAIAAHHLGASVLGISLVTNLAAGVSPTPLDHAEVLAAGAAAAPLLAELLRACFEVVTGAGPAAPSGPAEHAGPAGRASTGRSQPTSPPRRRSGWRPTPTPRPGRSSLSSSRRGDVEALHARFREPAHVRDRRAPRRDRRRPRKDEPARRPPDDGGPGAVGPRSGPRRARRGIVVGRDARHRSDEFAADVAEVASAAGLRVRMLPGPLPTPLTAFAVKHFGAAAGRDDHREPQPGLATTATRSTWPTAHR